MKIRRFWKYFVFVYLITFFIINWNDVSWVFSYRVISGIFSEFSERSVKTDEKAMAALNEPVISANNAEELSYSEKENIIEIPKIEISAPLVFTKEDLHGALDTGVVHFPSSVLPGETGQTIILGHSAPPGWPKIKYDWIFSRLNELQEGDSIFIYFNHQEYNYSVIKKIFLDRGEEINNTLTSFDSVLVLISCWPPGKDYKRIAVEATLNK